MNLQNKKKLNTINENFATGVLNLLTRKLDPNIVSYFNDLIQNNFNNYTIIYDEYKQKQNKLQDKISFWGIKEENVMIVLQKVLKRYMITLLYINGDMSNTDSLDQRKSLLMSIPKDKGYEYELITLLDFKKYSDNIINDIEECFLTK